MILDTLLKVQENIEDKRGISHEAINRAIYTIKNGSSDETKVLYETILSLAKTLDYTYLILNEKRLQESQAITITEKGSKRWEF